MVRVAIDAMGGDNAPEEIVKGAIEALSLCRDLKIISVSYTHLDVYKRQGTMRPGPQREQYSWPAVRL